LAPFITFEFLPIGARASEALEIGELDFLIAPRHLSSAHPTEVLFEDSWTCIAWTENRSIGESLRLDDYLALGHVVVQIGEKIMSDEDTLRRFKYRRRLEVSVPSFSLAPHLVVGTDRIATVKTRLALKYQRLLPIRLLPLPFDIPPSVEALQWHRAHEHHPSHRWFRCLLKEATAALSLEERPSTAITRQHAAQRAYGAKEWPPKVRSHRARDVNTKRSDR
jgi:DNA-binding transcriptional LysR family regulator